MEQDPEHASRGEGSFGDFGDVLSPAGDLLGRSSWEGFKKIKVLLAAKTSAPQQDG